MQLIFPASQFVMAGDSLLTDLKDLFECFASMSSTMKPDVNVI